MTSEPTRLRDYDPCEPIDLSTPVRALIVRQGHPPQLLVEPDPFDALPAMRREVSTCCPAGPSGFSVTPYNLEPPHWRGYGCDIAALFPAEHERNKDAEDIVQRLLDARSGNLLVGPLFGAIAFHQVDDQGEADELTLTDITSALGTRSYRTSEGLRKPWRCPRCGELTTDPPAMSRRAHRADICSPCGTAEALASMTLERATADQDLYEWAYPEPTTRWQPHGVNDGLGTGPLTVLGATRAGLVHVKPHRRGGSTMAIELATFRKLYRPA